MCHGRRCNRGWRGQFSLVESVYNIVSLPPGLTSVLRDAFGLSAHNAKH